MTQPGSQHIAVERSENGLLTGSGPAAGFMPIGQPSGAIGRPPGMQVLIEAMDERRTEPGQYLIRAVRTGQKTC